MIPKQKFEKGRINVSDSHSECIREKKNTKKQKLCIYTVPISGAVTWCDISSSQTNRQFSVVLEFYCNQSQFDAHTQKIQQNLRFSHSIITRSLEVYLFLWINIAQARRDYTFHIQDLSKSLTHSTYKSSIFTRRNQPSGWR